MNVEHVATLTAVPFGPRLHDLENVRGRYPDLDAWIGALEALMAAHPTLEATDALGAPSLEAIERAWWLVENLLNRRTHHDQRWSDGRVSYRRHTAGTVRRLVHRRPQEAPCSS